VQVYRAIVGSDKHNTYIYYRNADLFWRITKARPLFLFIYFYKIAVYFLIRVIGKAAITLRRGADSLLLQRV
jgi:hypothetical protein